jgi:hypothetical protein
MRSDRLRSIALLILISIGIPGCAASQPGTPTPIPEPAPPYEEIFDTMYVLSGHDRLPDGPPVGRDGISDPEIREAVEGYNASLQGRRVENWTGWVESVNQSQARHPEEGYTLKVFMEELTGAYDSIKFVLLLNVPGEHVEKIKPPADLDEISDSWYPPLPKITFRGTIWSVEQTGQMHIGNVTLELEPQRNGDDEPGSCAG